MIVFLLAVTASLAALLGGYTALRARRWLNMTMALTSGLVLGLVTFDLLPEIFNITQSRNLNPVWPMITMTAGFLLFHLFEKLIPLHQSSEASYGPHRHPILGTARAVALSGHSFLDGLSIGVAWQVSSSVGIAVAIAVIGHRYADGFDTTTFMLINKNKMAHIKRWLGIVILMPIAGGLASLAFDFSETALAVYLGFFAGFILYISASNLLPEAHTRGRSRSSVGLTILGTAIMFIITRVI
ncbi:MAG TPA: ZIP family metal transporter [Candidatus Saccharimonadales bacterium]|nr:ZIP family metal transporter [Candidatus Saccharimonadales bacterium]